MIHGVIGKPRGGKSYFMVRLIVEELVNGSRTIVTNLPLVPGELNAYIQAKYPSADVDLLKRLRLISSEPAICGTFWRYRGAVVDSEGLFSHWLDLPPPNNETGAVDLSSMLPALDSEGVPLPGERERSVRHRCVYHIDEAYNYYNARQWQKLGVRALWYCAQHAKLGDDVYFATHSGGDIDKQMIARFQDFIYLRNHSKERILGIFRGLAKMSWRQYGSQEKSAVMMDKGSFAVDVSGIGKCYQTDAGVGIGAGMGGDVGQKAKGVPIWAVWVALAFLIPLGAGILPLIGWFGKKAVGAAMGQAGTVVSTNIPAGLVPVAPSNSAPVPSPAPRAVDLPSHRVIPPSVPVPPPAPVAAVEVPKIAITAYSRLKSGKVTVYFSDGSSEQFPGSQVKETRKGLVILEAGGFSEMDWATSSTPPPSKSSSIATPLAD